MASGDLVGQILAASPPATLYATQDVRAGGSTPAENVPVMDFDDSTVEYMDFYGVVQGYDGGGLTVRLKWSATSATSGDCVWSGAFRRVADDAEDVDTAHTYDYNNVTVTAPSASGEVDYAAITFTDGADMDSLADGEAFILRVRRFASDAADTMTGDAELWPVPLIEET